MTSTIPPSKILIPRLVMDRRGTCHTLGYVNAETMSRALQDHDSGRSGGENKNDDLAGSSSRGDASAVILLGRKRRREREAEQGIDTVGDDRPQPVHGASWKDASSPGVDGLREDVRRDADERQQGSPQHEERCEGQQPGGRRQHSRQDGQQQKRIDYEQHSRKGYHQRNGRQVRQEQHQDRDQQRRQGRHHQPHGSTRSKADASN